MAPPITHIVLALGLYVFITTAQINQVKPGQCPPGWSQCPPQTPKYNCQKDDDCYGQEKCCNWCGKKCLDLTKVTTLKVKRGSCPMELDFPSCDTEEQRRECEMDRDCRGGLKCCQSGCGTRCVFALQDKRGSCPSYNTSSCALQAPPSPDECHQDLQCPGSERCCCIDCVRKCTATVTGKSGQCPAEWPQCDRVQKHKCEKDGECSGQKKCCDLCGKICLIPTKERDGFCPVSASCVAPRDKPLCFRDIDCPPRQKCCLSMNRMECMEPMAEFV